MWSKKPTASWTAWARVAWRDPRGQTHATSDTHTPPQRKAGRESCRRTFQSHAPNLACTLILYYFYTSLRVVRVAQSSWGVRLTLITAWSTCWRELFLSRCYMPEHLWCEAETSRGSAWGSERRVGAACPAPPSAYSRNTSTCLLSGQLQGEGSSCSPAILRGCALRHSTGGRREG